MDGALCGLEEESIRKRGKDGQTFCIGGVKGLIG
jgi:hypothetical protein